MEKKIKVAVLGCGNRGRKVTQNLLRDSNRQVEIAAIYDPDASEMNFVNSAACSTASVPSPIALLRESVVLSF